MRVAAYSCDKDQSSVIPGKTQIHYVTWGTWRNDWIHESGLPQVGEKQPIYWNSEVLESPTFRDVYLSSFAAMNRTGDYTHCYFEGLRLIGILEDVMHVDLIMGS